MTPPMSSTMTPPCFCILVRFVLHAGARDAFVALVTANASASVADEPGCLRFDVLDSETEDEVLLYELYTDEAAFAAHRASPHFLAFDAATASLVADKTVRRLRAQQHAK